MSRRYPVLTAADLEAADACQDQVAIFRATFPRGAPLTVAALRTAQAAGLDVQWAECLLDGPAQEEYDRADALAWAAYQKAIAPAREKYLKATTPAREEYMKATARAWEEYLKVIIPAQEEYLEAIIPVREEYLKAIIPAEDACREAIVMALLAALRSTLSRKEGATS